MGFLVSSNRKKLNTPSTDLDKIRIQNRKFGQENNKKFVVNKTHFDLNLKTCNKKFHQDFLHQITSFQTTKACLFINGSGKRFELWKEELNRKKVGLG